MYSLIPFEKYTNNMDHFFDDIPRFFFTERAERFQKEEISLDLKGDVLTVTAHHQEEKEAHTGRYLCRERRYGDFARSFDVSSVQQKAITASYENGVLKLVLPKKSAVQPESSKIAIG